MPRPPAASLPDLLALLRSGAPVPAARLVQQLGVTRPVLSRLVAQAGRQVLRIGNARATTYVACADTDAGNVWPLWRMRPDATLEALGSLHALRGERFQFVPSGERPNLTHPVETVAGHYPGLPWFLDDLRPQGFLGRTLAHRQSRLLGIPQDLNRWQQRDTLLAITRTGGTGMGDLLLGQHAVDAALAELADPPDALLPQDRSTRYADWAQAALAGEDIGSSPGGEQPKFTATVRAPEGAYSALVKFAVPDSGQAARRWADLLVCEHLALSTLNHAGLPAAGSELIDAAGHTCLEVRRFDRTVGARGRRGFVSLMALNAAFIGEIPSEWGVIADRMYASGWITAATATRIVRLHWFGRLIGNSDMHAGNLGFHLADSGPLDLAPAYDMLPMSLAPSRTGAVRLGVALQPSAPARASEMPHLIWAADAACHYWAQVADDQRLQSTDLPALALRNRDVVAGFARAFG
jgi:hypothetical protein